MCMVLICHPRDELVAFNKDDEQICREIGADALIYQDLEELKEKHSPRGKHD